MNKQKLKRDYLKPKVKLRRLRLANEWTSSYVGALIGMERRQYELKEKGQFAFKDYEMAILAENFGMPVEELFF